MFKSVSEDRWALLEDENIDGNVYEGKRNVVILTDRESRIEDKSKKIEKLFI